jgi:hypothetical protein
VPDRNGDLRRAIVFELVALDDERAILGDVAAASPAPDSRWTMALDELRQRASRTVGSQPIASEAKRRTYERSEDLRVYVRRRADGRCEGCGSPAPFMTARGHPYLEPHHTRRLSDAGRTTITTSSRYARPVTGACTTRPTGTTTTASSASSWTRSNLGSPHVGRARGDRRLSRRTLSQAPREGGISGRSHVGSVVGGVNGDHS